MSAKSSKKTGIYPPTSSSYPQFIAPFGDESGSRAALRLSVSTTKAKNQLHEQDHNLPSLRQAWINLLHTPWPLPEEHTLSWIDLDPQVQALTRTGSQVHLCCALVLCAYDVAFHHLGMPHGTLSSPVSSIWAIGTLDPEGALSATDNARTDACFRRFIDYLSVQVSDKKHVFFAPQGQQDEIQNNLDELAEILEVGEHLFLNEETLEDIFLKEDGPQANIVYIPSDPENVVQLLETFSIIWSRCHTRAKLSSQAQPTLEAGHIIRERYHITHELGAGGFAVVYAANDTTVDRDVAIKVIDLDRAPQGDALRSFLKRFEREARLAARVKHPCIVEVYDFGLTDEEVPFMVMELLEGWDLDHQMRNIGPMDPQHVIDLFIPALEGLGYAHEQGIVHKDLKPSNLFLKYPDTRREQVCILDFGVARARATNTDRLTQTSHVYGTPHYMAPEYSTQQIATPALDVYQMALILVEMLTGTPVVNHPDPLAAMFQHVQGRLEIHHSLLDSNLGPILQRALSTDHRLRYPNGFAFADALREVDATSIPAPTPSESTVMLRLHETSRVFRVEPTSEAEEDLILTPPMPRHGAPRRLEHAFALAPTDALERLDPSNLDSFTLPEHTTLDALSEPSSPLYTPPNVSEVMDEKKQDEQPKVPKAHTPPKPEEEEPIFQYSSNLPYIVLIVFILGALIAVIAFWIDSSQTTTVTTPPDEVVTAYDRELARVRERARKLPEIFEQGDIDRVLEEAQELDKSEARLNFDEVAKIQKLVQRARAEKPNRHLINAASALLKEGKQRQALRVLKRIPRESIFFSHTLRKDLTHECLQQMRIRATEHLADSHPNKALNLVSILLEYEPKNREFLALSRAVHDAIAAQKALEERDAALLQDATPDLVEN